METKEAFEKFKAGVHDARRQKFEQEKRLEVAKFILEQNLCKGELLKAVPGFVKDKRYRVLNDSIAGEIRTRTLADGVTDEMVEELYALAKENENKVDDKDVANYIADGIDDISKDTRKHLKAIHVYIALVFWMSVLAAVIVVSIL